MQKKFTRITPALILASTYIYCNFFTNFNRLPELHNLNLKLCSKQYNKVDLLHLIVVPQLSVGWQHNYLSKTRQSGQANEQSMYYSLMSMG